MCSALSPVAHDGARGESRTFPVARVAKPGAPEGAARQRLSTAFRPPEVGHTQHGRSAFPTSSASGRKDNQCPQALPRLPPRSRPRSGRGARARRPRVGTAPAEGRVGTDGRARGRSGSGSAVSALRAHGSQDRRTHERRAPSACRSSARLHFVGDAADITSKAACLMSLPCPRRVLSQTCGHDCAIRRPRNYVCSGLLGDRATEKLGVLSGACPRCRPRPARRGTPFSGRSSRPTRPPGAATTPLYVSSRRRTGAASVWTLTKPQRSMPMCSMGTLSTRPAGSPWAA